MKKKKPTSVLSGNVGFFLYSSGNHVCGIVISCIYYITNVVDSSMVLYNFKLK